jgi:fatty acid desaturase
MTEAARMSYPMIPAQSTGRVPGPRQLAATSSYTALTARVRQAGLLRRTPAFYLRLLGGLAVSLAVVVAAFVLLGDSWWQLVVAAALGVLLTQVAFVAHEASHRQVFDSGQANDRLGRLLANGVVGISHTWWMSKHSRHHANPNQIGRDPDIESDTLSFIEEDAAKTRGLVRALNRVQGYAFFPLLTLEGLNLHWRSVASLLSAPRGRSRTIELTMLAARLSVYVAVVVWVLPIGIAAAFLGVQLAVFGVYMGASFAPNHKGMAIVEARAKLDFLSKQVLTSRNIRGGAPMRFLMGGLNYQIEHHLFPSMSRPNLARARVIVRAHCAEHGVPYTETGLVESYRIVVAYLNRVGLAARDPFDCPMLSQYRLS